MAQRLRVRLLAAGTACGRDFLPGTAATVTTGARYDPARIPARSSPPWAPISTTRNAGGSAAPAPTARWPTTAATGTSPSPSPGSATRKRADPSPDSDTADALDRQQKVRRIAQAYQHTEDSALDHTPTNIGVTVEYRTVEQSAANSRRGLLSALARRPHSPCARPRGTARLFG